MCFFSSPKTPSVPATPTPSPSPSPIRPSAVEAQVSDEERRRKLSRMRFGLASTIKTSSKGLTGGGSDLLSATILGKDKLGV